MKKMNALIPARGGSKGVPKKNIKELIDHPLLAYSISACRMAGSIERVIVSTDSQEIADVALRYGAEVPFIRPPELATDSSKDIDVIEHYFKELGGELKEEINVDVSKSCIAPIGFSTSSYSEFDITLLLYICRKWIGTPLPLEGNDIKWIVPKDLKLHKMPEANSSLIPILLDLI